MNKILLSLLVASALFSAECKYEAKSIDVNWEAYKTPLKLGVKGTFNNVHLEAKVGATAEELLEGASVVIDINRIYSKNAARDAKLVKFFFGTQNVKSINATIVSVKKDVANVEVTMNGVTKVVPMKIEIDEDEIEADGYLDLADFKMLPALAGINKACYDLHQGKTWQDVEVKFTIKTQKDCK
jgi:polyisoprenoid-binding protein YceI